MSATSTEEEASEAFRRLFDREHAYVLRSLLRHGVDERDVPDVAQEVFLTVHRRLSELDPGRPARPWLLAFVSRIAANHRRLARHRREGAPEEAGAPATPLWDPEESAIQRERREVLLDALDALPYERRTVLVLCDLEGLEPGEVASMLEIPRNTVYSRLRTARGELAAAVRKRRGR